MRGTPLPCIGSTQILRRRLILVSFVEVPRNIVTGLLQTFGRNTKPLIVVSTILLVSSIFFCNDLKITKQCLVDSLMISIQCKIITLPIVSRLW